MESANRDIDAALIQGFWKNRSQEEDNRWTSKLFFDFEIKTLSDHFEDAEEMRILDLGSGSGSLSRNLARNNDKLTAVDSESSFARFYLEDNRFNFFHCAVDKFSSEEIYDLILLFGVVTHLSEEEEETTYKKMALMMKESGVAVVKNQCSDSEEFIFNGFSEDLGVDYCARYPNSLQQQKRLLKYFTEVEVIEYPIWSKKFANSTHFMFICRNRDSN